MRAEVPAVLTGLRQLVRYWFKDVFASSGYRRQLRRAGVDLSSVGLSKLGLTPAQAHNYADSGGPHLERVLKELAIGTEDSVLDLGCGKGGALITFARFPFRRIAGLDLCAELLDVARANMAAAGLPQVELIHADAASFEDYDDFTYIYMYNPFPAGVLREVMVRLETSLDRMPREVTIIYKNPRYGAEVERTGRFVAVRRFDHAAHPFIVYRNTRGAVSQS